MEDNEQKQGRGRPREDLYEKHIAGHEEEILEACNNGADMKSLANFLGIGLTTITRIKKEYPKFKELVQKGNKVADEAVAAALFKRAMGYDAEDTITEVKVSQDGSAQTTYVKKCKKHIPGDTTAMIFWLKNRMPDKWRDKQEMNLDTTQPINISIVRDKPAQQ